MRPDWTKPLLAAALGAALLAPATVLPAAAQEADSGTAQMRPVRQEARGEHHGGFMRWLTGGDEDEDHGGARMMRGEQQASMGCRGDDDEAGDHGRGDHDVACAGPGMDGQMQQHMTPPDNGVFGPGAAPRAQTN